jgi:hypothetical protein
MRELILDFGRWETDSNHQLARYIDYGSNLNIDLLALLKVLVLRSLEFLFVASYKKCGDVVRVW